MSSFVQKAALLSWGTSRDDLYNSNTSQGLIISILAAFLIIILTAHTLALVYQAVREQRFYQQLPYQTLTFSSLA